MLTQARLKSLLNYDPLTGVFTWRVRRGPSANAGDIAGSISKAGMTKGGGYRKICVDGAQYYSHRLAFLYMAGEMPKAKIDHKDRDRDNNKFDNLRNATVSQNAANCEIRRDNTSGFKGVSWNKNAGKWIASIQCQGVYKYLGLYLTVEEAHLAYCLAAKDLFREFSGV